MPEPVAYVGPGEGTSLGVASSDDTSADPVFKRLAQSFDFRTTFETVHRDQRLLTASDRWRPGGDDPDRLVPGDLPIIRGIVAGAHLREMQARLDGHLSPRDRNSLAEGVHVDGTLMPTVLAAVVAAMTDAVPFFLDGPTAMGVMTSTPPPPETVDTLRLPFESVMVCFEREVELPTDEMVWPDYFDRESLDYDAIPWSGFHTIMEQALIHRGGSITGLVLLAGPGGVGLSDFVLWVVSANPDPTHPVEEMRKDRQRSSIIGYRHNALWRHLIDNIAASVAWMDWSVPDPLDLPDPNDKQWRKAVRTSQFRKREPWGAAAGVRTVTVKDTHGKGQAGGEHGPGRSGPTSHLRRGHWRPVRVATRDIDGSIVGDTSGEANVDWHYEGRWIAPTVVNPGGTKDDRVVVYRIPIPD